MLLLDDLGAHRVTDWVVDTVTSIVNFRYNNRKPLIATANLVDPDISGGLLERSTATGGHSYRTTLEERIGERARLFEMCKVVMMSSVADYRIRPHRS